MDWVFDRLNLAKKSTELEDRTYQTMHYFCKAELTSWEGEKKERDRWLAGRSAPLFRWRWSVAKGKKRALLPTSHQSLSPFSPCQLWKKGVFLLFGDRFEDKLISLPLLKEGHSWRHFLFWIHWSKLEVRADSKKLSRISNIKNLAQCSTSGYKVDCPQTFLWSVVWSFPVRGRHSDIYSYVISLSHPQNIEVTVL